ncbi:hypothetical protein CSC3H3_17680 [Thalassospira marina]|uniref:Uncharacterized protein n=1 Tax=Thalassospira marina TaxID=2048283 RepID=A0ABN5FJ73_9PROT|nr:hypothetical protein CSC3H3_17680 [Thalassospira marina]
MGGPYAAVPDWPGRDASDVGHARITAFLVLDIQQSLEKAEAVRNCILGQAGLDDDDSDDNEIIMNAYGVSVGPVNCVIEPAFDETGEAPVSVLTTDLLAALERRIADIKRVWHE